MSKRHGCNNADGTSAGSRCKVLVSLSLCHPAYKCVACAAVVLQVSLLASGRLMYHGRCTEMIPWFQILGYTYTRGALFLKTHCATQRLSMLC